MTRANDIASLVNASGVDVTGTITADGVSLGDGQYINVGDSSDLQLFHDGNNSNIKDNGTGNLKLLATNFALQNSAANHNAMVYTDGGAVSLYHNNSKKFETSSNGTVVTGNVDINGGALYLEDNQPAYFGYSNDLQIYHDGSHSYVSDSGTGNLQLSTNGTAIKMLRGNGEVLGSFNIGDSVDLYYNNAKKLSTTSYGLEISGSAVADTHNVSSASGAYVQNFDTYQHFKYEMSGNVTLNNPTTEKAGQSGHMIFIQDATGGRTLSIGTDYETVGGAGITLSSAANATDIVPYVVLSSGRILLGTPQLAFA